MRYSSLKRKNINLPRPLHVFTRAIRPQQVLGPVRVVRQPADHLSALLPRPGSPPLEPRRGRVLASAHQLLPVAVEGELVTQVPEVNYAERRGLVTPRLQHVDALRGMTADCARDEPA